MLNDFKRLLGVLQRKIYLMVGRALLTAVNNSGTTQLIQLTALYGETISSAERFQEYGFETYPFTDSEALLIFPNGNRENGFGICVMDRQYRPDDLSEGEVAMYTDEDKSAGGHRIWFKRGQIIQVDCKDVIVNATGKVTVNATTGVDIDGGLGNLTGGICGRSYCHLTGKYHADVSQDVKMSKT